MNQEKKVDVCLVTPPLTTWNFPSLALSLLKACLRRENISCIVDYASLRYAKMIGWDKFANLLQRHSFIGEVVFAELAGISPRKSLEEFVNQNEILEVSTSDSPISLFRSPIISKSATLPKIKPISMTKDDVINLILDAKKVAALWLEETVEKILAQSPKIVGVTSTFQQHNAGLAILRQIKNQRPKIKTMIGGSNCMAPAGGAVLKYFPFVDYVFLGEADEIFAEVCQNILSGKENFNLPYGVLRQGEPLPKELPHRLTQNMENLPCPDYDDYFNALKEFDIPSANSKGQSPIQLLIEGSRGCWWGEKNPCTFCGMHAQIHKHRFKTPQRILEEIKEMLTRYGNYTLVFSDSIMSHVANKELPELIKTLPQKLNLVSEVKSNLTEKDVKRLVEAGFTNTQPGIESLNDYVLKLMNKGNTAIRHIALLKYSRQYGMNIYWNLLYNFPSEKAENYEEQAALLPLISHLQPPLSFNEILFHRNSVYQRNPSAYGLKLIPDESYKFFVPDDEEYLNDYAYCFTNENFKLDKDLQISHDKVRQLVWHWYLLYNVYVSTNSIFQREHYNFADRLEQYDSGEVLKIFDLRECHVKCYYELKNAEREIYLLCRSPISRRKIYKYLENRFTVETIDDSLKLLQDLKILIGIREEFLSLAIDCPDEGVFC